MSPQDSSLFWGPIQGGGPLFPRIPVKNYIFLTPDKKHSKSIVFHKDPGQQGTPPGLLTARAAKRIRKADINICREGRAESIGFFIGILGDRGPPSLDGVPEKTLVLGTHQIPDTPFRA